MSERITLRAAPDSGEEEDADLEIFVNVQPEICVLEEESGEVGWREMRDEESVTDSAVESGAKETEVRDKEPLWRERKGQARGDWRVREKEIEEKVAVNEGSVDASRLTRKTASGEEASPSSSLWESADTVFVGVSAADITKFFAPVRVVD